MTITKVSVRQLCKLRHGHRPCIQTYAADLVTVTGTYDCVTWCPLFNKPTEEEEEEEDDQPIKED